MASILPPLEEINFDTGQFLFWVQVLLEHNNIVLSSLLLHNEIQSSADELLLKAAATWAFSSGKGCNWASFPWATQGSADLWTCRTELNSPWVCSLPGARWLQLLPSPPIQRAVGLGVQCVPQAAWLQHPSWSHTAPHTASLLEKPSSTDFSYGKKQTSPECCCPLLAPLVLEDRDVWILVRCSQAVTYSLRKLAAHAWPGVLQPKYIYSERCEELHCLAVSCH